MRETLEDSNDKELMSINLMDEIKAKTGNLGVEDIDYDLDEDTCSQENIEQLFQKVYYSFSKLKLSDTSSCKDIQTDNENDKAAVSMSESDVNVIDLNRFDKILKFTAHTDGLIKSIFSPDNNNLIYTCSSNGVVKLFDIRSNKEEKEFKDDEDKQFASFDVSPNNRILSVGTELLDEDAFLLFWDIRGTKLLGGYWEGHSDEITSVKFNPSNPDMLASGSVDGLVNFYDIKHAKEEDAFIYCMNAEGTINKIIWENMGKKNHVFTLADAAQLDFWNIEESVPIKRFSEDEITKAVKRKMPKESYIISIFNKNSVNPIILIGSGMESGPHTTVRALIFNKNTKQLEPFARFLPKDQENLPIVRAAIHNFATEKYVTACEDGSISVWSSGNSDNKLEPKITSKKSKSRRVKPY